MQNRVYCQKVYTLLGRHHETLTLSGTQFAKTLPLLTQIYKKEYPLCHNCSSKVVYHYNCWRVAPKIRPIYRNFCHSALFLAQPLENPYPLWHTFGVQNPTLSHDKDFPSSGIAHA